MELVTILMTRNEKDIIEDCLIDRLKYFDLIAIVDSSVDGATEIIKKYIDLYPNRFLYKHDLQPHTIKHHRELCFDLLKGHIDDDTWIWQLDTDIYLHGDMEEYLSAMSIADSEGANCMVAKIAQFYPTREDIDSLIYWKDFQYYSMNWQSKIVYKGLSKLFFKNANQETPCVPDEKKSSYMPIVKHYQYRSLHQIGKKANQNYGHPAASHIISKDAEDYVIDKEFLSKWEDNSHRRPHHSWRSLVSLTKEKNVSGK